MSNVKPTWKFGRSLWQEDECTKYLDGHEYAEAAWARIFGEPMPDTIDRPSYDLGDCFGFLMPNGATLEHAFDGSAIYAASDRVVTGITGCSRCGGNHGPVIFRAFVRPISRKEIVTHTHWALCPQTGEPILMIEERDDVSAPADVRVPGVEA